MQQPVSITESAIEHFNNLIASEGKSAVRLSVKGGGCAGFSYQWDMTNDVEESDTVVDLGGGKLLIDDASLFYVLGTTINYKKELFGSYLEVQNPNAKSSCGCGESVGF